MHKVDTGDRITSGSSRDEEIVQVIGKEFLKGLIPVDSESSFNNSTFQTQTLLQTSEERGLHPKRHTVV